MAVYDTGSDWWMCEVHTCENCDNTTYNYADEISTTFSEVEPYEEDIVHFGGDTWVRGFAARDRVCLTDDYMSCVDGFKWLAI